MGFSAVLRLEHSPTARLQTVARSWCDVYRLFIIINLPPRQAPCSVFEISFLNPNDFITVPDEKCSAVMKRDKSKPFLNRV